MLVSLFLCFDDDKCVSQSVAMNRFYCVPSHTLGSRMGFLLTWYCWYIGYIAKTGYFKRVFIIVL